ncbi:MAG: CoA-disulfide reductase, partial [Clostridiales bacterium]
MFQGIANENLNQKKVLIIGGVAGGASAAARLRRLCENAEIILFEKDEYISFANCGLPYYIGATIEDRDALLVQTPDSMKKRFNIDVRINSEVVQVDPAAKIVTVNSKNNGVYQESYDYLVLSPGAKAIKPDIPGVDSDKIFTLRNIADTDAIKSYVDNHSVANAVVIGGGFVGVEMAENFKKRGISVTIVEAAPHILTNFDLDMATIVEKELLKNEVNLILGDGVSSFHENDNKINIVLRSGKSINADLAVLAIGVTPNTAFIKNSGIKLGKRAHILVNEKMETNMEGIYAVGDAIEVVNFVTKQITAIPLAGPANKQGRIVADNIAGLNSTYKGTQGSAIIKVFGLTAAVTGANERALKEINMPYQVIYLHPASHATYYPGAVQMDLKLIFNEDGKILGAQCIGADGVDKRIDVISTVIKLNGTVSDLTELELSYAPPYSSAKDPVNMAGYVAEDFLCGISHLTRWADLTPEQQRENILLDVRTAKEFNDGHLEGALNIPVDSLRNRLNELDKDKNITLYCQVGLRGYIADRILSQH